MVAVGAKRHLRREELRWVKALEKHTNELSAVCTSLPPAGGNLYLHDPSGRKIGSLYQKLERSRSFALEILLLVIYHENLNRCSLKDGIVRMNL